MSKKIKIWLIAAASLILTGGGVFVITMTKLNWDFTKLSTVSHETNEYTIGEEFRHISIHTSTADIKFLPSDDDTCKVVCHEAKKEKHSVSVEDGVLTIHEVDTRKWYEYINFFSFDSTKITVWLPEAEYGKLTIKQSTGNTVLPEHTSFESLQIHGSTGDIYGRNIASGSVKCSLSTGRVTMEKLTCAGDITIGVSTGDIRMTEVTCGSVTFTSSTGDVKLKNVIASGKCSVETDTGDVKLDRCDAAEIDITVDTGDIKGTLLTDKVFIARSHTGRVDVPETTTGGKCKTTTDTGDIILSVQP